MFQGNSFHALDKPFSANGINESKFLDRKNHHVTCLEIGLDVIGLLEVVDNEATDHVLAVLLAFQISHFTATRIIATGTPLH